MYSVLKLIDAIINIYIWLLVASAVMSWMMAFDIVNTRNRFVYMIADFLYRITEPALRPLRRIIPNFGGIDVTPVALILLLWFARNLLFEIFVS